MNFVDVEPTLENYWRAIILFGKNTASYKFALAKSEPSRDCRRPKTLRQYPYENQTILN